LVSKARAVQFALKVRDSMTRFFAASASIPVSGGACKQRCVRVPAVAP